MVAWTHPVRYSFQEYIAHEAASNVKHEYMGGQIYAMAGGTPEHSALILSIGSRIVAALRGTRWRGHMADLRIRVGETGLATYPDLAVVCGAWERDREDRNTITNPSVLIEVLSPSTETYDRGEKFEHYKRIPTLRHYVLVAHDRREIEVWTRGEADRWDSKLYRSGGSARIESIDVELPVDAAYDDAAEPASG
jgi:Uma2 family endonuclease